MGRSFQMVQIHKFIQSYHIPFINKHPDRHATYNHPPSIRNKLPGGNFEIEEKFYYECMDEETETTQKNNFVEAHFVVGKSESLFIGTRQASDGAFWELDLFLKPFKCFLFKEKDSERACKGVEEEDGGGFNIAVSASLPMDSAFDDSPVSNSLNLTSSSLYSLMVLRENF